MSIQSTTIPICQNSEGLMGSPGIKYKITNKQGVISYLIGTSHIVDEQSIKDPDIKKIIDKCSTLYTESGTWVFISSAHGSIPEENHQYQCIPLRFEYDLGITLAAWCKKIPIVSLDYSFPGEAEVFEKIFQGCREAGPDKAEARLMNTLAPMRPNLITDAWKHANMSFFENSRKDDGDTKCIEREKHWAKTLVPHLQTTTQPICIAVGVYHVVGDGLPEIFKKAGLKIEWIAPAELRPQLTLAEKVSGTLRKVTRAFMPTQHSRL